MSPPSCCRRKLSTSTSSWSGVSRRSHRCRAFNRAMSQFKFNPPNVLVTLLDGAKLPLASWLFQQAYPVKWSVSDLDATSNSVVIERMELVYQHMQPIGL